MDNGTREQILNNLADKVANELALDLYQTKQFK